MIPLVTRPGRPRRPRPAAARSPTGGTSSAACSCSTSRRRRFVFTGIAERAGAVAQPRLLGADQARSPICRRDDLRLPRRARQRSVQPLAGGADARDARCWSTTSRGCAPASDAAKPTTACSPRSAAILADTALEPAFVALGADACRAKPTSPARSAATSIPTRSSAPAPRLRAAIGDRISAPRWPRPIDAHDDRRRPISPDAASAGRRALRNICLDLLAATGAAARDRPRVRSNIEPPTT